MDGCSMSLETNSGVCENLLDVLGDTFDEILHIEAGEEARCSSDAKELNGVGGLKVKSDGKCLSKCVTFPPSGSKFSPCVPSNEENYEPELAMKEHISEEHGTSGYLRSISFPTSLKLVSAMKGTREKLGSSPQKLTVTWAPDVHDPPPTSVSHFLGRGNRQQKVSKKDKKNGKRGQKGKDCSRGGAGKDSSKRDKKKKHRRTSGSSNMCLKLRDDDGQNGLRISDNVGRFDIGSSITDSSCGSSFFMNSLTKVHYSAAEAL